VTRLAGKYELVRLLGRGGMAEVWEAFTHGDAGFRRRVALKRLSQEHVGDEALARLFIDEARLSSLLHHPNVVSIIDFGVDAGVAFQVMELVDGVDAGHLVGTVPLPLALGIVARIGQGLHAAHTATDEHGAALHLVHRDVSPQNILLSRRGEVKLSDFGIARWKHRTERTLAGSTRGKPSYMAPEQATKGEVDARTDVFSLGCTLHALCAGTSPLADENALVDLLAGVPLPLASTLPEPVLAMIRRAVERDRQARFPDALAFAQACEAALQSLAPGLAFESALGARVTSLAPPPALTPSAEVDAVPRRSRIPVVVAGVVLLGGVVALGVVLSQPPEVQAPVDDVTFQPLDQARRAVVTRPVLVDAPPPPTPTVRPPTPRPPLAKGVIAVGGERFLRGEIFVDGKPVGFAPRQLEVTVGMHPVEVVLPSGERVGPRVLQVGAQHTEVSPLKWVDPGP
jgi:hypothetical protein